MMSKKDIRREFLYRLKNQNAEQRRIKSQEIKHKLFLHPEYKAAEMVMFYIAEDIEVDTESMIRESLESGKKVAIPITVVSRNELIASLLVDYDKELTRGPYGILEPKSDFVRLVPLEMIDLVIVPAIVFDKKGNRLGHGTGYFDRFLSKIAKDVPTIGLAFDFQVIDFLPTFSHDVAVKEVLSN
ncbi:MAG: 5-formyltetrahydrofolate cyclo-ligase [Candidatus Omnitrophica bacterium]|nr:5-formyltetrahydrofolate cyclo-ligase [Candidatus Omnitrophota bacterium]